LVEDIEISPTGCTCQSQRDPPIGDFHAWTLFDLPDFSLGTKGLPRNHPRARLGDRVAVGKREKHQNPWFYSRAGKTNSVGFRTNY
jgi:hypothetical protein